MNDLVKDLQKYRNLPTRTSPDLEHYKALDAPYHLLRDASLVAPTTFRLPLTISPALNVILKNSPYSTKAELVYKMLQEQIISISESIPDLKNEIYDAAGEAVDMCIQSGDSEVIADCFNEQEFVRQEIQENLS